MVDPEFKVGDKVEAEESGMCKGKPRWNGDTDTGASGKWIRGVVVELSKQNIQVEFENGANWFWRREKYDEDQWNWPGQLRHIKNNATKEKKYSLHSGYFKELLDDGYFPEYNHLRKRVR